MRIGIHHTKGSFSERWIKYCTSENIDFRLVDCYRSDIITQLSDCDVLMWHFHQNNPKDILFAKQLLYSLEAGGKRVFPDFNTVWHFDDKVGQKYLLESIGAPLVPTWIFYSRESALGWAKTTLFPKVFKLRGGGGSQNVKLVSNRSQACRYIKKAFRRGFPAYDPLGSLKERWRLLLQGRTTVRDIVEGLVRFVVPPPYARLRGSEKGYVYFQEFIHNNNHDIRVIVIGDKAFAIKRMVRRNDFRASGSGDILYEKENFDDDTIKLSFCLAERLRTQCVAFDYLKKDSENLLVEISFGFTQEGYDPCPGYWDKELNWHEGSFDPCGWMIDLVASR